MDQPSQPQELPQMQQQQVLYPPPQQPSNIVTTTWGNVSSTSDLNTANGSAGTHSEPVTTGAPLHPPQHSQPPAVAAAAAGMPQPTLKPHDSGRRASNSSGGGGGAPRSTGPLSHVVQQLAQNAPVIPARRADSGGGAAPDAPVDQAPHNADAVAAAIAAATAILGKRPSSGAGVPIKYEASLGGAVGVVQTEQQAKRMKLDNGKAELTATTALIKSEPAAAAVGGVDDQRQEEGEEEEEEKTFITEAQLLCAQLFEALFMEGDIPDRIPHVCKMKARALKKGAHSVLGPMCVDFAEVRLKLSVAQYLNIQNMYKEIEQHVAQCMESLMSTNKDNPAVSAALKDYLQAVSDQYVAEVSFTLEELAETKMGKEARNKRCDQGAIAAAMTRAMAMGSATTTTTPAAGNTGLDSAASRGLPSSKTTGPVVKADPLPHLPGSGLHLPQSVLDNLEPYFQGLWRREPFPPRAYQPISQYVLSGPSPEEQQLLALKLTTQRPDGASEHFRLEHGQQLPGNKLRTVERRLASAVQSRRTLVLGKDVVEVDTWGMDMYTRKNVFSALYEAGLFRDAPQPDPDPMPSFDTPPDTPTAAAAALPGAAGDVTSQVMSLISSALNNASNGGQAPQQQQQQLALTHQHTPQPVQQAAAIGQPVALPGLPLPTPVHVPLSVPLPATQPTSQSSPSSTVPPATQAAAGATPAIEAPAAAAPVKQESSAMHEPVADMPAAPPALPPPDVQDETMTDAAVTQILTPPAQQQQPEQGMQPQAAQDTVDVVATTDNVAGPSEHVQQHVAIETAAVKQELTHPGQQQQQEQVMAVSDTTAQHDSAGAAQQAHQDEQAAQGDVDHTHPAATVAPTSATTDNAAGHSPDAIKVETGITPAAAPEVSCAAEAQQQPQQQVTALSLPAVTTSDAPVSATATQQTDVPQTHADVVVSVHPTTDPSANAAAPVLAIPATTDTITDLAPAVAVPSAGPIQAPAPAVMQAATAVAPPVLGEKLLAAEVVAKRTSVNGVSDVPAKSDAAHLSPEVRARVAAIQRGALPSTAKRLSFERGEAGAGAGGDAQAATQPAGCAAGDAAAQDTEGVVGADGQVVAAAGQQRRLVRRDKYGRSIYEEEAINQWIDRVFLAMINKTAINGFNTLAVCKTLRAAAIERNNSHWHRCADAIEARVRQCGWNYFRLHPKGRGIKCAKPGGIPAFSVVEEYLGEIHSPWRWWEIQGLHGYNMLEACDTLRAAATASGNTHWRRCADAIDNRIRQCGWNYYRIHPKGKGVQCARPGGIPAFTFVEECLGEVHSAWRWWEIQDAIKRLTGEEELPDFYNITLERPRDDPDGFDMLYVEAAVMATFASRMSHSCTPNCSAVVVSAGGRLTIAMYTLRHIQEGEEMTFDYSSVTESEKEFRSAICLCGTQSCRGSYLHFLGAKAFQLAMDVHHTLLQRQAIILRACCEPLTQEDTARLKEHALGAMALSHALPNCPPVPTWLLKWTSLTLEYVELEKKLLPDLLLGLGNNYTMEYAQAQAQSVLSSRLTSILVTLDRIKLILRQPGQLQAPPLRMLCEQEILEHLWTSERSIIRKLMAAAVPFMGGPSTNWITGVDGCTKQDMIRLYSQLPSAVKQGKLGTLLQLACRDVTTLFEARRCLLETEALLRCWEEGHGCHTAAADLLHLAACTVVWFTAEKNYKGFTSPPVVLSDSMLKLHKSVAQRMASAAGRKDSLKDKYGNPDEFDEEEEVVPIHRGPGRPKKIPDLQSANLGQGKRYGPWFIWGQLNAWHKQTISDPSGLLSVERRGPVLLPDIDSCYILKGPRYTEKERAAMLKHLEEKPDVAWKFASFTFRNETKVYGSPMFDAVYLPKVLGTQSNLPGVIQHLKNVAKPMAGNPPPVQPMPNAPLQPMNTMNNKSNATLTAYRQQKEAQKQKVEMSKAYKNALKQQQHAVVKQQPQQQHMQLQQQQPQLLAVSGMAGMYGANAMNPAAAMQPQITFNAYGQLTTAPPQRPATATINMAALGYNPAAVTTPMLAAAAAAGNPYAAMQAAAVNQFGAAGLMFQAAPTLQQQAQFPYIQQAPGNPFNGMF